MDQLWPRILQRRVVQPEARQRAQHVGLGPAVGDVELPGLLEPRGRPRGQPQHHLAQPLGVVQVAFDVSSIDHIGGVEGVDDRPVLDRLASEGLSTEQLDLLAATQVAVADLRGDVNLGPGKLFVEGIYVSGGDNPATEFESLVSADDYVQNQTGFTRTDMLILFRNGFDINGSLGLAGNLSFGGRGLWHVAAGYSFKPMDKLTLKAGAGYAQVDEAAAGAGVGDILRRRRWSERAEHRSQQGNMRCPRT